MSATRLSDSPLWGPQMRALLRNRLHSHGRKETLVHCRCGALWARRHLGALICTNGHNRRLAVGVIYHNAATPQE